MTAPLDMRWTWLFLDVPRASGTAPVDWWAAMTHTTPSPWRPGDRHPDTFTTLQPSHGPAWLKLQRVDAVTGGGLHLDLDVDDPRAAAPVAEAHGAAIVAAEPDVVVVRSPGGFTFCLTTWSSGDASERAMSGSPREHAGASLVDQLCLDVPPGLLDRELAFWADLTGCDVTPSPSHDEFHRAAPDGLPLRLLVQRRDESAPGEHVTGHLDLACADRATEVERHVDAGASVVGQGDGWTVLVDPWGRPYCCTDRSPRTGRP